MANFNKVIINYKLVNKKMLKALDGTLQICRTKWVIYQIVI